MGDPKATRARGAWGKNFGPPATLDRWQQLDSGVLALALECGPLGASAEVSISGDGSVRIRVSLGDSLAPDPDTAIGRPPFRPVLAAASSDDEGGVRLIYAGPGGGARVEISRAPFGVRVRDRAGTVAGEVIDFAFASSPNEGDADGARASFLSAPSEAVFGLGGRGSELDLRGNRFTLRSAGSSQPGRTGAGHLSIPFFMTHDAQRRGHRSCGVLFDSLAACHFDLAASQNDRIVMETASPEIDVSVFPGPHPRDVVGRFATRAGRTALPPYWALGHHQAGGASCSERDLQKLARELRARSIPADAIHLGADYMHQGRAFTWDRRRFRDPKSTVASLREEGLRVVALVDPGVKVDESYPVYRDGTSRGLFCEREDGSPFSMRARPGDVALPDFNRPEVRTWWAEQHAPLLEAGISGVFNDMNEPAGWRRDLRSGRFLMRLAGQQMEDVVQHHPAEPGRLVAHEATRSVYALQECRAARSAIEQSSPERRPFVLSRSGYAGIQQFAAVSVGDPASRWESLRDSIPSLLNLSLSGVAFCGADIGGRSARCTPELFARWVQIGALYPFSRSHGSGPRRRGSAWQFGARVESIAREALELRMRLLPYLYELFHLSAASGEPVWRSLAYDFPDDPQAATIGDQVMLGPFLMAAPVVAPGLREREVYLPPGHWICWHTDARYVGPRRVAVAAPLDRLPLFARAGAIVPTQSPTRDTRQPPAEPVVLEVFPGHDGRWELVEDDGESQPFPGNEPSRTALRLRDRAGGRLRVEIGRREGDFAVPTRPLRVVVRACAAPTAVYADGELVAAGEEAPCHWVEDGRLNVLLSDDGRARSIEVEPSP